MTIGRLTVSVGFYTRWKFAMEAMWSGGKSTHYFCLKLPFSQKWLMHEKKVVLQ